MAILVKSILEQMLAVQDDWRFSLLSNWSTIIGPLHEQVRVERITEDTLIVGVYDAHWMQELFLLSRTLVRTINTYLGKQCIQKIHFKLIEKRQDVCRKGSKKSYNDLSPIRSLTRREEEALSSVADDHLQIALKSFLERILRTNATPLA